ncbi:hypothetical protein E4K67_11310 [Desulfosporosinus fructosivorans]|uniref:Uncharacterized protein n=1 Tax=Desulfosporosinus fructosivorans TaxID=2018669 RepID=A0A4Z0R900_9FIRM|nr:hypothetical protein [Desulfosporosinus fructosivorans]TGE38507.1 hypothetical protein E4K67_11310 [Desulfosporosinus fructosivorans]
MEMHELDKRIKRALLSKTNEILPSEETFTQILAGLEKKKARRSVYISYKHYIIAFICAVSVIFGTTLIPSVDVKNSATEMISTVTTVIMLDKSNKVFARNANELFKHIDSTQLANADNSKRVGASVLFLRTFTRCFLLNKVNKLELYLRLLIIGRMTMIQTLYDDKFRHRQVPLY